MIDTNKNLEHCTNDPLYKQFKYLKLQTVQIVETGTVVQ